VCDEHTWRALVEASWRLGDRLLELTVPNLRGDDVDELQTILARLGFDCGRVDGIFGTATLHALEAFQHDCGLTVDGRCGPITVRALQVLARQSGTGPGVAALREVEALRGTRRTLGDLRIVIGQFGGLSALSRQLTHAVQQHGATVTATDELDATAQAAAANRFAATVYLGFEARSHETAVACFYRVPSFESWGGRALAEHLVTAFGQEAPSLPLEASGMRLPILRETRMPAVLCCLGPVQRVIDATPSIVRAVVGALDQWVDEPVRRDLTS
jgi:N-acetylmuramoyl-L-alanine amidase